MKAYTYKLNNHDCFGKEVVAIDEVRNTNKKRICDVSRDRRLIVINIGGCPVRITANADGTFNIEGAIIISEAA